jgi:hypothetical protein
MLVKKSTGSPGNKIRDSDPPRIRNSASGVQTVYQDLSKHCDADHKSR